MNRITKMLEYGISLNEEDLRNLRSYIKDEAFISKRNDSKFYKGHFCTVDGDWYELEYEFCDNRLFFSSQPKKVLRKVRMVKEYYFEDIKEQE